MSEQYEDYGQYNQQDYGQGDYGDDYENHQMEVEQDYQTKVQLDFFEAQQLLRKNEVQKCIASLQELYTISEEHQLKNWKIKILNLLLQIYCRSNNPEKIHSTLQKISDLNKKQKYTQNSIKSIIMTIKSLPTQSFNMNKQYVYEFINQLDNVGKVRSFLLFLEKAIEQNNNQEAEMLFKTIQRIVDQENQNGRGKSNIPPSNLIQLYSFEIRHSKNIKKDISKDIKKMQLKLTSLEGESYMSEGHISVIKQAIGEILYQEDNFADCAVYLCEAFQQNVKYGKSSEIKKNLLKTNLLVCLLTNNKEIYTSEKYSALYNEAASAFKGENDIQSLYGMVEAFNQNDIDKFTNQTKMAMLNFHYPYENILNQVILRLKMNKLLQIIKPYSKIKLAYLERRLNSPTKQVEQMIFELISDNKINGRLRKIQEQKTIFLDIYEKKDDFLDVQLENIRDLRKRYL